MGTEGAQGGLSGLLLQWTSAPLEFCFRCLYGSQTIGPSSFPELQSRPGREVGLSALLVLLLEPLTAAPGPTLKTRVSLP